MAAQPNNPATWNLLIADDDPDALSIVALLFNFHKIRTRNATTGPQCLQLLQEEVPDLLLLDIQMPGTSGWQIIQNIRNTPDLKHLPVVAVTAHAMAGDRERILAAGFDAYLPKPLSPLKLIDELARILTTTQKAKSTPE